MSDNDVMKTWIYEALNVLIKEPTEENRKIVADVISSEIKERFEHIEKQNNKMKAIIKASDSACRCCKHHDDNCSARGLNCNDFNDKWELDESI